MTPASVLAVVAPAGGIILGLAPLLQLRIILGARSSVGHSLGYWLILWGALGLWLAYGISIGNWSLILANGVSFSVATLMVGCVWAYHEPKVDDSEYNGNHE